MEDIDLINRDPNHINDFARVSFFSFHFCYLSLYEIFLLS